MTQARPLAVTMGEPSGIGGEAALAAWLRRDAGGTPPFFLIDDPERVRRLAAETGLAAPVLAIAEASETAAAYARGLPVLPLPRAVSAVAGRLDAVNAAAVICSIETAVRLVRNGDAAAVVTNPIHKKALYDAGFAFPGHTEFLGALAGVAHPVMMLAAPALRVVPVTIHLRLRDALDRLAPSEIVRVARVTADALRRDFGVAAPRLAVAGVNPHAGEGGALGPEDDAIVRPAIEALRAQGIDAFGPQPPDTMFTARARPGYDAAICMYHDQALIPLKALYFDGGVNVTLGLPFVRTSPDHGAALDIAGRGVADPSSLIAAMRLAAMMADRRAASGRPPS